MSVSKVFSITSGIAGLGGVGTLGAYGYTLKTIGDEVKGHCLPSGIQLKNEKGIWKKVYEKWSSNHSEEKTKFKNVNNDSNMKEFCEEAYKDVYWSWFTKKEDLLTATKKYCVLDVKTSLQELEVKIIDIPSTEENQNETIFKKHLKNLKSSSDINNEIFSTVKNDSTDESNWKELQTWCSNKYSENYIGDNEKIELIKKYCVRED